MKMRRKNAVTVLNTSMRFLVRMKNGKGKGPDDKRMHFAKYKM